MSINIDRDKCVGCGLCLKVCPGNLLYPTGDGKARIRYPKDCWGCTACLKECRSGAIQYFLGPDLGGQGTCMHTVKTAGGLEWRFVKPNGSELRISVNEREANKY